MADVKIDLHELSATAERLDPVAVVLEGVAEFNNALVGAVGHRRLGGTVAEFGNGWNVHRRHLIEQVIHAHDTVQAIHDTFVELDHRLEGYAGSYAHTPAESFDAISDSSEVSSLVEAQGMFFSDTEIEHQFSGVQNL